MTTANEQIDSRSASNGAPSASIRRRRKAELVAMLMDMGMTRETAVTAATRYTGTRTVP